MKQVANQAELCLLQSHIKQLVRKVGSEISEESNISTFLYPKNTGSSFLLLPKNWYTPT
jgi:hypothetical protein